MDECSECGRTDRRAGAIWACRTCQRACGLFEPEATMPPSDAPDTLPCLPPDEPIDMPSFAPPDPPPLYDEIYDIID